MAVAKVQVNARLDQDLYDAARTHVVNYKVSMSDTIASALRMYLSMPDADRRGKGKTA